MPALFFRQIGAGALGVGALCMLVVTAAAALGTARPSPDMRAVLGEPPCVAPCWHTITPGLTPFMEAVNAIYSDPALEDLSVNVRSASWWWNGAQPESLSHVARPFDGRMIVRSESPDSIVDGLALMTTLTLGDLIGRLGPADRHILYFPPTPGRLGAIYAAEYGDITVFSTLHCPVQPSDFWMSEAGVAFGAISLDLSGEIRAEQAGPSWPIQRLIEHCAS